MKREEQPIKNVEPNELIGAVEELHKKGCRFVQACCTKLAENQFEITYSFDKDYKLENLRVTIPQEIELPSITGAYGGAFLYENEMHELFGISFKGINIDFKGHLYKKKVKYPFNVDTNKVDESCQKK
jgi:ech hydrogenase subunit D